MPRFFVSKEEIGENFMVLTGENAAHGKVLRLKNGDEVMVCDGEGTDYRCIDIHTPLWLWSRADFPNIFENPPA